MIITEEAQRRMNRAVADVTETIGKTMNELNVPFQRKYGLTRQLLNVVVAQACLTTAAAATAGALDSGLEG
jgi:hypothetical protein